MNLFKYLLSLIALMLVAFSAVPAHAGPSFPTPPWCYRWTSTDAFNNPGAWSQWDNANTGGIFVGNTAAARTPSRAALMSFNSGSDIDGAFLVIDREFAYNTNITETYQRPSCLIAPVPYSYTRPSACEAHVWVRPDHGIDGVLQLIDATNYAYLASKPFILPPSSLWHEVIVSTSNFCSANIIVRIGANKTSGISAMVVDDLQLIRYYI